MLSLLLLTLGTPLASAGGAGFVSVSASVSSGAEKISGVVNLADAGASGSVKVLYGTSASLGSASSAIVVTGDSAGSAKFAISLSGLIKSPYFYKVQLTSSGGNASTGLLTFVVPGLMSVDGYALPGGGKELVSVVVSSTGNATSTLAYGLTSTYGSTAPAATAVPSTGIATVNTTLSGLQPNTVYHLQATVVTNAGTFVSKDHTFTTGKAPYWHSAQTIDPGALLRSVSCAVADGFCGAIDGEGRYLTSSSMGSTWTSPVTYTTRPDLAPALSVSCVSASFCAATDSSLHVVRFNSAGIIATDTVTDTYNETVSCASATYCMTVDYNSGAHVFNGSTWTTLPGTRPESLYQVYTSCVSSAFCVAVSPTENPSYGERDAYIYNGVTWANKLVATDGWGLSSISCVSSKFCVAVGDGGPYIYDGTTWTRSNVRWPATYASESYLPPMGVVSCVSTSFCMAVSPAGAALVYDGTTWKSVPFPLPSGATVSSVSCASRSFCVALDGTSHAFLFGA
ncbi:hypothetical protein SAMN05892883_1780 [Jatrophihabitans sp. GAS493]|nr:hypothetical protein SAMN05892883_1780 [Jatrophihabitans sp. GAS493]